MASARLQGGVPHFVGGGAVEAMAGPGTTVAAWSADEPALVADHVELVGRPYDQVVGDWLASVGESWSQLTFFLFDPESWR